MQNQVRDSYSNYGSYSTPYSYRSSAYNTGTYGSVSYNSTNYKKDYTSLRRENKPKRTKKKSLIQCLVTLCAFSFLVFGALPFTFTQTAKAFFPQKTQSDFSEILDLAFPTYKYISNSWLEDYQNSDFKNTKLEYLSPNLQKGLRTFNYSATGKHAQMETIPETSDMPVLKKELQELRNLYPMVTPAVYVWDYDTKEYIDLSADESYATASIIKIPVLIDVFKAIESGQISLNDTMSLTEHYRTEGSGSLQFKARNSEYTIDELARRMITESDNSATNMLMAKVGSMNKINQSIRSWGMKKTKVQTWLPDYEGTNRTTAREMATILYNIDTNDKFLSKESKAKIFDYMGHVHNNRLIQAGLSPDAVFLHKTGDIGTMLGDAGIVIAPNGKKYIVVILANRPHNSVAGKDFIVHASEIIYKYMVN